jgi:Holliday junction resolvase RusA-like endonuclease
MPKHLKNSILLFSDRVEIKPLSVNECWQGKRFKTKTYQAYEKEMLLRLAPFDFKQSKEPLELSLIVGVSNIASDADNVVKPFVDILQKKYNFNDKYIFRLVIEKVMVVKGAEFIEFYIKNCTPRLFQFDNSEKEL